MTISSPTSSAAPFNGGSLPEKPPSSSSPPHTSAHISKNSLGFPENPNPNVAPAAAHNNSLHGADQEAPSSGGNPKNSYAAVMGTRMPKPPDAFVSNLTTFHPVKHGNSSIVMMPEGLYSKRLQAFQYALIGRLFLPKGASSRPLPDLKSELSKILKPTEDWRLVPLGKGFFSLKFANQDDQYRASRSTSWKLACGSFHIREWKPDFDPYNAQTSMTQVWVRLFHLPEEYWDPDFLVGIFRAVGNVIKLDGHTAAGMVGHFARALVEIDLSLPITESIMIGRSSTSFQVNFGYENLPFFCTFCKFIGHSVSTCNHAKRKDAANDQKKADPPTRADKVKEKWVEKSKMPDSEFHANNVPTSNTFAVLQEEAPHFEDNSNDLQADESPPRALRS